MQRLLLLLRLSHPLNLVFSVLTYVLGAGIARYLSFYNLERPHQALGYQTPDAFYAGCSQAA